MQLRIRTVILSLLKKSCGVQADALVRHSTVLDQTADADVRLKHFSSFTDFFNRLILTVFMVMASAIPSHAQESTTVAHPEKPESWIGRPAIELFNSWGSPDQSILLEKGGSILIYLKDRKVGGTDARPYDSLSRRSGTKLRGNIQFRTNYNNRIDEFSYLNDEPERSHGGWIFFGGFLVGIVATIGTIVVLILVEMS